MATPARRVGAYAKLLANYAYDDALIAAGEKAELLFVRGLAFCATSDSDGFITDAQVVRYVGAGMKDASKRAQSLVKVGVWQRVDGGYHVRSWTKIHETAEQKGHRLKSDRERKRQESLPYSEGNPSGFHPESDTNPNGVQMDSKTESAGFPVLIHDSTRTGNPHDSAGIPDGPESGTTAQTIVGEWIDHAAKRPPSTVIGQVSKSVAAMLAEGINGNDVRRGLAAWMAKGLHPSTLPSVVNEVMNSPGRKSRPQQETDDQFDRAAVRMGVITT